LSARTAAVAAVVFGPRWVLTLLASDAPWWVVTHFWLGVALAVVPWSLNSVRREVLKRAGSLRSAVERNEADTVRIRAERVVELEEVADLGTTWAFETGDGRVVFVAGQWIEESRSFPSSDFTLVDVLDGSGGVVDVHLVRDGRRLEPLRRISADAQERLTVPGHLESLPGSIDDLESRLETAGASARGS
jgi:hypothetical protein